MRGAEEKPEDSRQRRPAAVAESAGRELSRLIQDALAPGLYLVATPIGNLSDISLRALSVLARADAIYCEDTRHSARLLHHFGIMTPTRPFHEHNEDAQRSSILAALAAGQRLAIISDAGTPLISDPGFKLVREAAHAGHAVIAIPGASALLAGLTMSGLPTDAFFFAGFLPPRSAARQARLDELKAVPGSLIVYEAPQRLAESLDDCASVLGETRQAAVARELTKLHEECVRGTLRDLVQAFAGREVKGECVLLIGPPVVPGVSDADILEALGRARADMSMKEAAKVVADALGVAKARVYALGVKGGEGRGG